MENKISTMVFWVFFKSTSLVNGMLQNVFLKYLVEFQRYVLGMLYISNNCRMGDLCNRNI